MKKLLLLLALLLICSACTLILPTAGWEVNNAGPERVSSIDIQPLPAGNGYGILACVESQGEVTRKVEVRSLFNSEWTTLKEQPGGGCFSQNDWPEWYSSRFAPGPYFIRVLLRRQEDWPNWDDVPEKARYFWFK